MSKEVRRNYWKKDWIMYEEVGNEAGTHPAELSPIKFKTADPEVEKHVPYITEVADGYEVRCGKNGLHDETPDHHQIFIELNVDNFSHKYYVQPGDKPVVHFKVPKGKSVYSNAFCNKHGMYTYVLSK